MRFFVIILLLLIVNSCEDIGKKYDWNEGSDEFLFYRKFGTIGYDYGHKSAYSKFDMGTIIVGTQQPNILGVTNLWAIKTNEKG